jgi:predicted small secreted protein
VRRLPLPLPAALVAAAVLLTGCGTLSRLAQPLSQAGAALFTSSTLADLILTGVKTGPLIPVQAAPSGGLDQETRQELTDLLGGGPAAGVLLPITRVGETAPWWIFCPAGTLQERCEEIPSNARVTFTGRPLGRGTLLLPSRITWSAR